MEGDNGMTQKLHAPFFPFSFVLFCLFFSGDPWDRAAVGCVAGGSGDVAFL